MGDNRRQAFALRAITVSGRAAISKARTPDEIEAITDRMDVLMSDLESSLLRDGGDEETLAAIGRERRQIHGQTRPMLGIGVHDD